MNWWMFYEWIGWIDELLNKVRWMNSLDEWIIWMNWWIDCLMNDCWMDNLDELMN